MAAPSGLACAGGKEKPLIAEIFGRSISSEALPGNSPEIRAVALRKWVEGVIIQHEIKEKELSVSPEEVRAWEEQDFAINFGERVGPKTVADLQASFLRMVKLAELNLENPAEAEEQFKKQLVGPNPVSEEGWKEIKAKLKTKWEVQRIREQMPNSVADLRAKHYAGIGEGRALLDKLKALVTGFRPDSIPEQEVLSLYWEVFGVQEATIAKATSNDPALLWRTKVTLDQGVDLDSARAKETLGGVHFFKLLPAEGLRDFDPRMRKCLALPQGASILIAERGGGFTLFYMQKKSYRVAPPINTVRQLLARILSEEERERRFRLWLDSQIRQHAKVYDATLAEALQRLLKSEEP